MPNARYPKHASGRPSLHVFDTTRQGIVVKRSEIVKEKEEGQTVFIPEPAKYLRHSSVDPFVIFPAQEDQYLIHEIIDHARNFYWGALAPIQHPATAPASGPVFYAHMRSSKMAFYGYIIPITTGLNHMVADHPHKLMHEQMRIRNTSLLLQAIRESLQNFAEDTLDEIIAAVLILAANPRIRVDSRYSYPASRFQSPLAQAQILDLIGIPQLNRIHLSGLKQLVDLRGGIDKIASTDLAGCVQLTDIVHASRNQSRPMFPYFSFFGTNSDSGHQPTHLRPRLKRLNTTFFGIIPFARECTAVQSALDAARRATIALDNYHHVNASPAALADLLDLRNRAQYLALSVPKISQETQSSPNLAKLRGSLIKEITRLTLLIYNNLTLYPLPPASGHAHRLACNLKRILGLSQSSCPDIWDLYPYLLLWSLTLGSISIESDGLEHESAWLQSECIKMATKLFGLRPAFEELEASLCEFMWLDWVLSKECERLYAVLVPETTKNPTVEACRDEASSEKVGGLGP